MARPIRVNWKKTYRTVTMSPVVTIIARCRCWTSMPNRLVGLSPHGSWIGRMSMPMAAVANTRTTTSMPRVMIATVNAGRPTIGRTATRSTPSASAAVPSAASGRATKNPSGPTRNVTITAPASMKAGWAKLITRVDL
jgi:hypothetical protein